MVTFAEFALPPETFPLGITFEEFPEATIELERVVPTGEIVWPYFWTEHVDNRTALEFFEVCGEIEAIKLVDSVGDRSLFRYRNQRDDNDLLTALVETDLTLLTASGTRNGWTLRVRGDERRAIAAFDDRCRAAGIPITLGDLQETAAPAADTAAAVTDAQREALVLAYQRGYYAEPRETTLATLADEVGISRQAFARRLRRGYRTLIRSQFRFGTVQEDVT